MSEKKIKIGCCGFPGGMKKYFKGLRVAEVQSTFYNLPLEITARKWRDNAPKDFEFVVKCWQAVTHLPSSPTWRKCRLKDRIKYKKYGHLVPSEENFEAWDLTINICKILKSRICIVQCPPSFKPIKNNIKNMKEFFNSVDRKGVKVAWEPRGDWSDEIIGEICIELDIIPVFDALKIGKIPYESEITYLRLHGLGEKSYNYSYKYTNEDLNRLWNIIKRGGGDEIYVMFNNKFMLEDSMRFSELI